MNNDTQVRTLGFIHLKFEKASQGLKNLPKAFEKVTNIL